MSDYSLLAMLQRRVAEAAAKRAAFPRILMRCGLAWRGRVRP